MSMEVSIEKTFSVQVDYVKCNECAAELEFSLESDGYGDLQITVDKCDCGDSE